MKDLLTSTEFRIVTVRADAAGLQLPRAGVSWTDPRSTSTSDSQKSSDPDRLLGSTAPALQEVS